MLKIRTLAAIGALAFATMAVQATPAEAGLGSWLKEKASRAKSWAKTTSTKVGRSVSSAAKTVSNKVSGAYEKAASWAKGAVQSVSNWWSCVGKSTSGGTLRTPTNYENAFTKYFSAASTGNSWTNAWLAALVAKLTYLTRYDGASQLMKDFGFTQVQFVRHSCRNAILAANGKMVLIAFEGASLSSPTDLGKVLSNSSKSTLGGKVHSGFYQVANEFWSAVKSFVRKYGRRKRVWLAGHSLGGAVATLTAAKLEASKIGVQGVYTFGQPRVGNGSFVKRFTSRIYRLVASGDCAPGYPGGFSNPGKILYFGGSGSYSTKSSLPSANKSPSCWTKHSSAHDISNYMSRIYDRLGSTEKKNLPSSY